MYGLGVDISTVFERFSQFPIFSIGGGGVTPGAISNILHILSVVIGC
jgi:hypothetical protein